ncbi:TPA: hypothetical protein ACNRWI_003391 [Escherichia coli]
MKNIPLPDNIDQLKALLRQQQVAVEQLNVTMKKQQARLRQYAGQVADYEQEIERLKAQLDKLRRMLFGQSSEKSRNKLENKIRQAEKRLAELENRLAAAKRCLQDDEPAVGTVEQAEPPVVVAPQDRPARRSRRQILPADLSRETRRIPPDRDCLPEMRRRPEGYE